MTDVWSDLPDLTLLSPVTEDKQRKQCIQCNNNKKVGGPFTLHISHGKQWSLKVEHKVSHAFCWEPRLQFHRSWFCLLALYPLCVNGAISLYESLTESETHLMSRGLQCTNTPTVDVQYSVEGACFQEWPYLCTVPWYSFSFQRWAQTPRHWNSQGFSVLFHVLSTPEAYQVADMACSNRKQLTSNLIGHERKVCIELALRHEVAYCLKKYRLSRENMLREEIKLRRMRRLLWEEKQNGFEKTKLLGDKHLKRHSKYSSGHLRCQV